VIVIALFVYSTIHLCRIQSSRGIDWSDGLWLEITTSCLLWLRTWRSRSSLTWNSHCLPGWWDWECLQWI